MANISNDKPDQGYENSIISAGVGTSFEQYKDVIASLGLSVSHDDLTTNDTASNSLKKQKVELLTKLQLITALRLIKGIELCSNRRINS